MNTKANAPKILICDDEPEILDITKYILEESGYRVITVSDSLMVIDEIRNELPDLVLIDLWMPGMTGDEVVRLLRAREHMEDLPIVVFSASKDGKIVAFRSGATDFVAKPYDIDQLLNIVEKHVHV